MRLHAGKAPDQPCVNRTGKQFALFGELLRTFDMIKNPADFRR
jgi:hypothetical protein